MYEHQDPYEKLLTKDSEGVPGAEEPPPANQEEPPASAAQATEVAPAGDGGSTTDGGVGSAAASELPPPAATAQPAAKQPEGEGDWARQLELEEWAELIAKQKLHFPEEIAQYAESSILHYNSSAYGGERHSRPHQHLV